MRNISNVLKGFIDNNPNKILAVSPEFENKKLIKENRVTYKDIKSASIFFRNKFGIAKFNKCVGIFISNKVEFLLAFCMAILNGYTVAAIDPTASDEQIERIIEENDIHCILTIKQASRKLKSMENEIVDVQNIPYNEKFSKDINIVYPGLEDILVISYTSGTSGNFSKGVKLSCKNISFVSDEYKKIYSLMESSKIITILPLWHNYAMFSCVTSAIMSGSELILMDGWNIEDFIQVNKVYKPDVFPGSPYMYIDIMNYKLDDIDCSTLRICDSGGDSLPVECINRFEKKTGAVITEGYGLTETTSLTHFNYSAKQRKIGSLGKAVENVECEIRDLEGRKVRNGNWGLLWIKGPMVFCGYVNNEKLNKEVLKDGWFNTNDVVKEDEEGYYYIAGRLSDIHNFKNMDISLRDIENIMYKCNFVKKVFVEKAYNTETRFYFYNIYVTTKEKVEEYKIYDYVKENLKDVVINKVTILESLPTTGTGKVKRKELEYLR